MNYPDDDDGQALRRVAEDGSDLSKPMKIDFCVMAPTEEAARAVEEAVAGVGYAGSVEDEGDGAWACYCSRVMVPTYDDVVRAQAELDALARPLGAHVDGWGTFGNSQ